MESIRVSENMDKKKFIISWKLKKKKKAYFAHTHIAIGNLIYVER